MGWIYNGTEFVEANKAQQKAYDDFKRHELVEGTLAQPFVLPSLAVLGGVLIGGLTLTGLLAVMFGPGTRWIKEKKDWAEEKVEQIVKAAKDAGVAEDEQLKLLADGRACMAAAESPIPGVTGLKFFNCMRKKGWVDDVIIEMINPFD